MGWGRWSWNLSTGERARVINFNFMLATLYAGKNKSRKCAAEQHSALGPVQMSELRSTHLLLGRPCRSIRLKPPNRTAKVRLRFRRRTSPHVPNLMKALAAERDLTNRFHVAVRLFSNKSQMTSKCGKNMTTWNLFVLQNNETNYYRQSFFISKSFNITQKPAFAHFGEHEKSHFTQSIICSK